MFFESPRDLPDAFWSGEEDLPFDPPTNVAEFTYGERCPTDDPRIVSTCIVRPAGWFLRRFR